METSGNSSGSGVIVTKDRMITMENPFSLKVGQVFTGFGIGCGIGIGVGRPINLGLSQLFIFVLLFSIMDFRVLFGSKDGKTKKNSSEVFHSHFSILVGMYSNLESLSCKVCTC